MFEWIRPKYVNKYHNLVTAKWTAVSPSTPTFRVQISPKPTAVSIVYLPKLIENNENKWKRGQEKGPFLKQYSN